MNASIAQATYAVDTDNSELSILRLASHEIYEANEKVEAMLETAKGLGAGPDFMGALKNLAGIRPTERALSPAEFSKLDILLVQAGLERLGVLPDQYGIAFGISRERGDGTIPVASLEAIVFAFEEVFANIRKDSLGDLTFNGVVQLDARDDSGKKGEIALVIRNSQIKVQRPTIVWEDVEDLVFEKPKPLFIDIDGDPADLNQGKAARRQSGGNGPFTKCWG
jgi:hypothetical protein